MVDDAIVVIENVTRSLQKNDLEPADAVKQAMPEATGPIMATMLVLLGLFVPVALVPGLTGSSARFASGAGANAQASAGITVIGGAVAATVLNLRVTPVLCMVAARLHSVKRRQA